VNLHQLPHIGDRPITLIAAKNAIRESANKKEMTMRNRVFTVLVVVAALTAQATAASERHHTRTKARPVASEQLRNSNAYAAPPDIAVQSDWSDYADGAMASGIAGH
jgi:hypothetical protein